MIATEIYDHEFRDGDYGLSSFDVLHVPSGRTTGKGLPEKNKLFDYNVQITKI